MKNLEHLKDLSNTRNFGPCKISHITNPYLQGRDSINQHIIKNIEELRQLLTPVPQERVSDRIEELEKFFESMNAYNALENMLTYGDATTLNDHGLTNRLINIDRGVQAHAARDPQYKAIRDFWNQNKTRIPEKMAVLIQNHERAVEIARLPDAKEEFTTTKQRQEQLARHINHSALQKEWSASARAEALQPAPAQNPSILKQLGTLFTKASETLPGFSAPKQPETKGNPLSAQTNPLG